MSFESDLLAALAAVAPVTNLYAPDPADRSTWQAGFTDAVTTGQREAAAAVLATFVYPVPPSTPAALVAYANAKQWALATGGFTTTVAGTSITFDTSVDGIALVTGASATLQQPNGPPSVNWQSGPSTVVSIKAADFIPAALKVSGFVDATFAALAPVFASIASGQITTAAQIDAASWPANAG